MSTVPGALAHSRIAPRLTPSVIALIAFFSLVDLFAAQAILPFLAVTCTASPSEIGVAVNASTAGMAIGAFLTGPFVAIFGLWLLSSSALPSVVAGIVLVGPSFLERGTGADD